MEHNLDTFIGNENIDTNFNRVEAEAIYKLIQTPEWRIYRNILENQQKAFQAILLSQSPTPGKEFAYEFGRLQWPANNLVRIVDGVVEQALLIINPPEDEYDEE